MCTVASAVALEALIWSRERQVLPWLSEDESYPTHAPHGFAAVIWTETVIGVSDCSCALEEEEPELIPPNTQGLPLGYDEHRADGIEGMQWRDSHFA